MTDPAPDRRSRHGSGAVLVGLLVAGFVIAVFAVPRADNKAPARGTPMASPSRAPAPAVPSTSASAAATPSATVLAAYDDASMEAFMSTEAYRKCAAYANEHGYEEDLCFELASTFDDGSLPFPDSVDGSAGASLAAVQSLEPVTSTRTQTAGDVRECSKQRTDLGLDPGICGRPGDTHTLEARVTAIVSDADGDSLAESTPLRAPGFDVKGDFDSVDDADHVRVRWPGGSLALSVVGSNVAVEVGVAGKGGGTTFHPLESLRDGGTHRSVVAAGDYVIRLAPADPNAPLAPYTLTVGAPA